MKKVIVFILLSLGTWHISASAYMLAKAQLSQHLIKDAWLKTLKDKQKHKPWSWADTYPVFEISVPRLKKHSYILEGTNGRNMAFSAARISNSGMPAELKSTIVSGHRDSHFEYLQYLKIGDKIVSNSLQGERIYEVISLKVIDSDKNKLVIKNKDELILTTCYPFNAIKAGGKLRFIVVTRPV